MSKCNNCIFSFLLKCKDVIHDTEFTQDAEPVEYQCLLEQKSALPQKSGYYTFFSGVLI